MKIVLNSEKLNRKCISLNRLNGLLEDEWYKLLLLGPVSRTPDDNPAVQVQVLFKAHNMG